MSLSFSGELVGRRQRLMDQPQARTCLGIIENKAPKSGQILAAFFPSAALTFRKPRRFALQIVGARPARSRSDIGAHPCDHVDVANFRTSAGPSRYSNAAADYVSFYHV
jgi:hypothetical protein